VSDPILDKLARELTDQGKLIEAGWIGMRAVSVDPSASPTQLSEMRLAFFAGAQHLFASIMGILDPGAEPTDKDLERMSLIHNELEEFIKDYKLRHIKARGQA